MKLLCVQPGADYATGDVFRGFAAALRDQGHDVGMFNLSTRLDMAGKWLNFQWAEKGKPPEEQPTDADVLWLAGGEVPLRALYHEPDWVIVWSGMYLHPDFFVLLRRAGQRVALVLSESPYDDVKHVQIAPYVDLVCTNERLSLGTLLPVNPNTLYLPHAYNPRVHWPLEPGPDVPRHDVVFVGTAFQERIELLEAVDWTGIDLGLYGWWELLREDSPLRPYVKGSVVMNAEAVELYRAAKISLNTYRSSTGFGIDVPRIESTRAESLNPRAYELAAAGCFHLSEYRAELPELFGDAVPTFDGPEQLEALIREYLADGDRRTRAAERARQAVLPHCYAERAERLIGHIERLHKAA